MHGWMIGFSLLLAVGMRWVLLRSQHLQLESSERKGNDFFHWQHTFAAFLMPPILLLLTAVAMLQMGTTGVMLGVPVGRIGFVVGWIFLASAGGIVSVLGIQGWRSLHRIRSCPSTTLHGYTVRILDTDIPFAGQIGFWTPELVVSRSLMDTLESDQIAAVLAHENAHAHYHDTFWYFWLGCLRTLTCWLPKTRELWQELLLLREIRADRWATQVQSVDPILLAESLLQVVRVSSQPPHPNCATFHVASSTSRLKIRINSLIAASGSSPGQDEAKPESAYVPWQFCIVIWPLLAIALHH
ncbi:MAG: M56 family metallopeptidase [Leptolyngbyaceae bacterium]|nr:M56 family metallopeptidase [Leptolyngbyaceae bacterium]